MMKSRTTILILINLLISFQASFPNNITWHRFETSCYTILTTVDCVGVSACSDSCVALNSYLAEINTPSEMTYLRHLVHLEDKAQYWVGVEYNGTDKNNGVHRWVNSKQVVNSTFWKERDPNYYVDSCTRLHQSRRP